MYSTTQNSRQGAAHAVMSMDEYKFTTRKYVNKIRPQQDPSGRQEELFLLPGAKPVYNPAALIVGATVWHQCRDVYKFEEDGGDSGHCSKAR